MVYRSWWFTVLLALLAINIFFAAVKKWPWKKQQTGFLITHLGLLTLLAGGMLNSMSGLDAQMQLIDTDDTQVLHWVKTIFGTVPRSSSLARDGKNATIVVSRAKSEGNPHAVYGKVEWFKITDNALDSLRREEVPEATLSKLKSLKGKEFETRNKLTTALESILTRGELERAGNRC